MFRRIAFGALAAAVISAGGLPAQDGTLGRSYLITPKLGMDDQFDAAISAHAALRRAEMDPWSWAVYTIETGEDAGSYFVRSGNHQWADFDAYDAAMPFQQKVGDHWRTTVSPLIGEWSSMITAVDTSVSLLPTPMPAPAAFVNVTGFKLRPGMERQFFEGVGQAHAALKKANWPHPYLWAYPLSGHEDGPIVWLVSFHDSWADMAEPDPSFEAILMREMGEEEFGKWAERIGASMRGTTSATMRYRPDLSVMR